MFVISNCKNCNKEIKYSMLSALSPENLEITRSELCSNGSDGCWEKQ